MINHWTDLIAGGLFLPLSVTAIHWLTRLVVFAWSRVNPDRGAR